jgi:hypothetical protein
MKTRFLLPLVLLAAGCAGVRATGDMKMTLPGPDRAIEMNSKRTTIRLLNRGACPLVIRHGDETWSLATSEDRELVLEGEQVLTVARNGEGEGLLDIHFTTEGRHSFVNLK